MSSFGLKTNSLKWLTSFNKRIQVVMVNSVFDEKTKIICGVSQGSVLGLQIVNVIKNLVEN